MHRLHIVFIVYSGVHEISFVVYSMYSFTLSTRQNWTNRQNCKCKCTTIVVVFKMKQCYL